MHSYDALGPDSQAQTDYNYGSIRPDSAAPSQSIKTMTPPRDIVFLSKATPLDDEFALWLAPRLEAAGYKVFCDVLSLEPGDRWRKEITTTLQERAIKMLLICKDDTLSAAGVLEELEIASDLTKTLKDDKFIIPLRLKPFKKIFGIAGLHYINFEPGWAQGLEKSLEALRRQKVPRTTAGTINPNWESFRRRGAVPLKPEPERLTSNWLRIAQMPAHIHYVEPSGAHDRDALEREAAKCPFPVDLRPKGLLAFASLEELDAAFANVCRFTKVQDIAIPDFLEKGAPDLNLKPQDASNLLVSMTRQAWIAFAKAQNLIEHQFSGAVGFHAGSAQARVGQRIPWGRQGERRSAMLRNLAKGAIWQFGVTALPAFWPYPHIKLKARVLFAPPTNDDADAPFEDKAKQHRLRRSVCKGWRNKQWHGRLMAFLECLAAQGATLRLPLSPSAFLHVEASLLLFTSSVSTPLPDALQDEDEEIDPTTLGKPEEDEEDTP